MYLTEVILLTKIPAHLPQILSYFTAHSLSAGFLILAPLGKRQEKAIVIETHKIDDFKMEIKKAGYKLRPITKIISREPILTEKQIKLALWLGKYYLAGTGIFLKMMMPKSINNKTLSAEQNQNYGLQKLIITPTVSLAEKIAKEYKNAILWHSDLTKKQLNEAWWKIKNNKTRIIAGARSAVFLPFANLENITIEDSTNPNHKSWDMFPHYRTHEAAKKLAGLFNAKLNIKSEAPTVEHPGNFTETRSVGLCTIDMKQELKNGNFSIFSQALKKMVADSLARKKQIILFSLRRGAANFVLCRDCGYIAKCSHCEAPFAYHFISKKPILLCHRCGLKLAPPDLCPTCQSHRIKTVGAGTQKIELEAGKMFPGVKISRLDSDSAPDAKTQKTLVENFFVKKIDILIATQTLFSWTYGLKKNDLNIAIISADTLLHLPDFNSGERTYQIIETLKNIIAPGGLLLIQTYNPENSVINRATKNDWQSFYQEEIETRQALGYPPFSQIVKLTFRHKDPKRAGTEAKILMAKLKHANKDAGVEISDALPAFIPKEKSRFVWNIIIKFKIRNLKLEISNEFIDSRNSLLQYVPTNWEIDVDPENLL